MEMEYFPYKRDKEAEERWAIDAQSILDRMNFLEEFYGDLDDKTKYYTLKRELLGLLLTPTDKTPETKDPGIKTPPTPKKEEVEKDGTKASK